MSLDYKFYEQKRRMYQQLILIDPNDNQNEPSDIESPILQEIQFDDEIRNKSIELMEQKESPLSVLDYSYPECYPAFDYDFLYIFSNFLKSEGPDCEYLLEKIVFSNDKNAFQLATLGILDFLFTRLPSTFEIMFKIMESNPGIMINHFLNTGGLFLLIYFSKNPELQLIIAHIFLFITDSPQCKINSELSILPPAIFGDYFINEKDITYDFFFQTLLFSENVDVQITCLRSIEKLFGEGRNEVRSLENILIDKFSKLLQVAENEPLLPYILQTAYYFNVGAFSREFLNICHYIFQNNYEPGLKSALYFISNNIEFICVDEETSEFVFDDLFKYIEEGSFKISRLATFGLISFMSKCSDQFYDISFERGLLQSISNIFLTFDPSLEDENKFKLVMIELKNFLKKLMISGYQINYENKDNDLNQLIESLQPFQSYKYDKIINLAKRCINLCLRINGVNTEEEDVSEDEFGERVVIDDDMRNDYDGHDYV